MQNYKGKDTNIFLGKAKSSMKKVKGKNMKSTQRNM